MKLRVGCDQGQAEARSLYARAALMRRAPTESFKQQFTVLSRHPRSIVFDGKQNVSSLAVILRSILPGGWTGRHNR